MNRLALSALTATILIPAGALAQPAEMPPPGAEAPARAYSDYRRLERGVVVPNRWWAPNYVIGDWSGYGLYQPMGGHRWVRYYDDALLIDDQGRVIDTRYGMDWGRWSSHWSYDSDGVPVLIGGGTAYAEHHGDGARHGYKTKSYHGYPGYGAGHAYPAHGYGGYGGWGYAGYGGAWVTETTVTYQDCCCEAEEVVYEQPQPAYTPPPPPPPPPPPRAGERG